MNFINYSKNIKVRVGWIELNILQTQYLFYCFLRSNFTVNVIIFANLLNVFKCESKLCFNIFSFEVFVSLFYFLFTYVFTLLLMLQRQESENLSSNSF